VGRQNKSQSSERTALESYFQDILTLATDDGMAHRISAIEDQIVLAGAVAELPERSSC
jgi:hypothetical protein